MTGFERFLFNHFSEYFDQDQRSGYAIGILNQAELKHAEHFDKKFIPQDYLVHNSIAINGLRLAVMEGNDEAIERLNDLATTESRASNPDEMRNVVYSSVVDIFDTSDFR